jgi:low affinity Fe/Cu permease
MSDRNTFGRFASKAASAAGHPFLFAGACAIIVGWTLLGPVFQFSDTWQLAINTGTTIVTFLMVFVIQNTQNRDAKATQIKLDEIIRSLEGAHNVLLDLEELSEYDLQRIRARYIEIAKKAREAVAEGLADTGEPEVILGDAIAETLPTKGAPLRKEPAMNG